MQERKDKWTVGQWMTSNPEAIPPNLGVRNAFMKMRSEGYRHLLVMDQGELLGIVTDRDLRRPDITSDFDGWDDYYKLDADYEVCDIMTTDVVTIGVSDSLEKALKVIISNKYGALPVVNKNNEVIGIITIHDLLNAFDEALDQHGEAIRHATKS